MTIQHCGTNQRKIDTMYHIISILVHALAFNIDSNMLYRDLKFIVFGHTQIY